MIRWFVVQSKPSQERLALQQIQNQGFQAYFPYYEKEGRDGINRALPLFTGYLFVAFDFETQPWRPLISTRGVKRLVGCTADHITPLPHGLVEQMMERSPSGKITLDLASEAVARFKRGQAVKVRTASADIEAQFISQAQNRVTLLLTFLGRPVKVNVPAHVVRPASCESQGLR